MMTLANIVLNTAHFKISTFMRILIGRTVRKLVNLAFHSILQLLVGTTVVFAVTITAPAASISVYNIVIEPLSYAPPKLMEMYSYSPKSHSGLQSSGGAPASVATISSDIGGFITV
jgi:hypothetical protein